MMKVVKIIAVIVVIIYVGIVVAFESMLGYSQPQSQGTMVITTIDEDGTEFDRVVSRIQSGDQLYVAVNHWPRNWYYRALRNPDLFVTIDGTKGPYRAVEVTGEEYERIDGERPRGLVFLLLTGFPPRHILRLEPRDGGSAVPPESETM